MNGEATRPQSRLIAALTYLLGFVTGVIFLYLEPYDKDEFVRFHARQSIVFTIAFIVLNIILSVFVAGSIFAPRAGQLVLKLLTSCP